MANPFGKLSGIWNSSREKDIVDIIRKQNDSFFPHHTTLWKKQIYPAFQCHLTDKNLKLSFPALKSRNAGHSTQDAFAHRPLLTTASMCTVIYPAESRPNHVTQGSLKQEPGKGSFRLHLFKQPNKIPTTEEIPSPSHFEKQKLIACRKLHQQISKNTITIPQASFIKITLVISRDKRQI